MVAFILFDNNCMLQFSYKVKIQVNLFPQFQKNLEQAWSSITYQIIAKKKKKKKTVWNSAYLHLITRLKKIGYLK